MILGAIHSVSMPILAVGLAAAIAAAAWWVFVNIAIPAAISYGLMQLMKTAKSNARPAGKEEFTLPTSEEGRPYPVVFGQRYVHSPNAITPLVEYRTKGIDQWANKLTNNHVRVGYLNYVTFVMGVCQGNIDGVGQIMVSDSFVWPAVDDSETIADDGETTLTIDAANCWGGKKSQGGVTAEVHMGYGGESSTVDSYLSALGSPPTLIPYRGLTVAILCNAYIGTQAVLRPWKFLCKRTDTASDGTEMWYVAKADIVRAKDGSDHHDLNAIHILYELLTSERIGLGKSASLIGDTFAAAADTCYDEGIGLSCVWDWRPDDIESLVQQIEAIVDGKLFVDNATGKFEIALHRDDYTVGDLEEFDDSDFWVESMSCSSLGSVPSRTIVYWHDRIAQKSRPARACDLSLLYKQGACPITQEMQWDAFVCDETLAGSLASREQMHIAALPKLLTLRALRTMSHLQEGDVVKISYPALNIASMVVRVVSISRGSLDNGECIVNCMEDVFGQSYTTYGAPPAAGTDASDQDLEEIIVDDGYTEITWQTDSTEVLPSPSASVSTSPSSSVSTSPSASPSSSASA